MTHAQTNSPSQGRVVVVGASLAGLRTAEALRSAGFAGEVLIVGEEQHHPYDRPPLSKALLRGLIGPTGTRLSVSENLRARWLLGQRAVGVELADRRVHLDSGAQLRFDGLVIATGSSPRELRNGSEPVPRGVHTLRTLDDAVALRRTFTERPDGVVVIGAGFIGTEVAASARAIGLDVTLADAASLPLVNVVGTQVGRFCADLHRDHGVILRTGVAVEALLCVDGALDAVGLADGTELRADLAVVGLGTVPNTSWLAGSGALLDAGVRTDASLRLLDHQEHIVPGVVAAGDIVRWPHPLFGDQLVRVEHWSNATDQARVAANTLLQQLTESNGLEPARYTGVPSFWSDQYDAKVMSIGLPHLGTESAVLDGNLRHGRFVVGYGRDDLMVGAVGVNEPRRLALYRRHIGASGTWPPPELNEPRHCNRPALSGHH